MWHCKKKHGRSQLAAKYWCQNFFISIYQYLQAVRVAPNDPDLNKKLKLC